MNASVRSWMPVAAMTLVGGCGSPQPRYSYGAAISIGWEAAPAKGAPSTSGAPAGGARAAAAATDAAGAAHASGAARQASTQQLTALTSSRARTRLRRLMPPPLRPGYIGRDRPPVHDTSRVASAEGRRRSGPARVVVLGGGFGGVYTALALERLAANGAAVEVALVNRENYLVFQPMLAEVIAGDVGILDTVSPLRELLARTEVFVREIDGVDLERRVVTLGAGLTPQTHELEYDDLVLALGNVTDFRGVPGLPEHALAFKTLADAVRIRNHVINVLEQASIVREDEARRTMLTFVIAGGGFSGTEAAAALNDFVRGAVVQYRAISARDVRVVLVHSGAQLLERELTPRLAKYATAQLAAQGIELVLGERLVAASPQTAVLS